MTTVMPEGEAIRRAVKWIASMHADNPGSQPSQFVSEAILRFDLSPLESDFLVRFYKESKAREVEEE